MDAFTKAFGPKKQAIEGEVQPQEAKMSAQDMMMSAMLKKIAPGLAESVQEMADKVGTGLAHYNTKLDLILANQAKIMAKLGIEE